VKFILTGGSVGEQWPELLQALLACSQAADPSQREAAFRIFSATPGIIEKQHENFVLAAFTKGFKDTDASVSAFTSCCTFLPAFWPTAFTLKLQKPLNVL
jgi:hypothetical protein